MRAVLPRTHTHPDEVAVITDKGQFTWAEVESRAAQIANGLRAAGLNAGDRWAILACNCLEWPEISLGNVLGGCKCVPLNWHLTVPELVYLFENSEANFLIVDEKNEANGRAAAHEVGITDDRIIVIGRDYDAWRDAQSTERPDNNIAGSALLYTGGTTGRSKGVVRADAGSSIPASIQGAIAWGSYVRMPDSGTIMMT